MGLLDGKTALIFGVAADCELASGKAFGALYAAFLGRNNGPRAGWLLASLEPSFAIARLRAAAGWHDHAAEGGSDEPPLAAAARVDLRLDHDFGGAELGGDRHHLFEALVGRIDPYAI